MSEGKTVSQHRREAQEMYGRFCLAARDYPWASLSVERDQLWDYWAMQWAHPAGTCAAYAMHEIEVQVFGRRKWR